MRNFAWQQEFLRVGKSSHVALDSWIDMRLLYPMGTSVFAQDPTAAVREDFRRRMVTWTQPYASQANTTQLDMMYAYKPTGHFGLCGPAFGAYGLVQSPLFFRAIFRVATSIHWRHRNGHGLMREMIQRLDPSVAAIVTTSGGPAQPMRVSNFHRFPYYSDIGVRAVNKLSERTVGRRAFSKVTVATTRCCKTGWLIKLERSPKRRVGGWRNEIGRPLREGETRRGASRRRGAWVSGERARWTRSDC